MAVSEPAEAIANLSKPRRIVLPRHLFDVFDRVKREVYLLGQLFESEVTKT